MWMRHEECQGYSLKRWYLVGLFIVFSAAIQVNAVQAGSSLTITDVRWTHEISASREPAPENIGTSVSSDKPLYLWVKLRGSAEAFEVLKTKRKLSVIHRWEYNYFGWKTERIDISIGRDQPLDDETIQKLGYEIEAQGYFEWRTWSRKENLSAHSYTVTIVDGFDEPFACQAEPLCKMTITLEP